MDRVKNSFFIKEMSSITTNMYKHGWDERNGGNISMLLTEEEVAAMLSPVSVKRTIPLGFYASEMANRYLLVTGTGKYFKNVEKDPENNLGLIRISADGEQAEVLWGFEDGGKFTSELPSHLMTHAVRLSMDPEHRIVMHCHPNSILAMTFIHDLDEKQFTKTLWQMCSECIMVFPDGVNVLPWMLCGTEEIGKATAEKMKTARIVVWAQHGIYATGRNLDEAFGLIETVEKAAEVYLKIAAFPWKQTITDEQLHQIEIQYKVKAREGYLNLGSAVSSTGA